MTLYFYAGGSGGSWDNSSYWYEDSGYGTPHNAVPTSTDDVILNDNINGSMSSAYCNTLITGSYSINIPANVAQLYVTTQALFQWAGDYTGYIDCPDVQFSNGVNHNGTVIGNATFYNSTYMGVGNGGNVSGTVNFYNTSYLNDMSAATTWPTSITFNDTSYNQYGSGSGIPNTVTVIFNGSSYNTSTAKVAGNATFNSTTQNIGVVSGAATFNGSSQNGDGMTMMTTYVGSGSIFNGSSIHRDGATVSGDAIFNDTSYCYGDVTGTATFSKTAAENMLDNEALPGTIGTVVVQGGGGINGSSILGIL